jgi:hypothetical protein
VVPAKNPITVTVETRAHAGVTVGRRVYTARYGRGNTAWTEGQETEGVGIAGLPTDDQYGTPEHGCQDHCRDVKANPIHAVVVRRWHRTDSGLGGQTVALPTAPVLQPVHSCDAADDPSLIANSCMQEAKPQ